MRNSGYSSETARAGAGKGTLLISTPAYSPSLLSRRQPLQEIWQLKLNSPDGRDALWLRFSLLVSGNGFKQIAETWGLLVRRGPQQELRKVAVRQTHDIRSFTREDGSALRFSDCVLSPTKTTGQIQSKGHSLKWDLSISEANSVRFSRLPESLSETGLLKGMSITEGGDLRFTGTTVLDGEELQWEQAFGSLNHGHGPRSAHSWVWAHSNLFLNEKGESADLVFEGMSARARVAGPIPSPKISALYFRYRGEDYNFNSLWDSIRIRSRSSLTEWKFQADRGNLSFRGRVSAAPRDFAGLTFEDTNGSFVHSALSLLSNLELHVYRRGKLEAAFYANGTAAFEVASRQRSPYVPNLV